MRFIALFIGIFLITAGGFAKNTEWDLLGLKGNVKSMKIQDFQLDPENGKQVLISEETYKFTKDGLLIVVDFQAEGGEITFQSTFKYKTDSSGNIIDKKEFDEGKNLLMTYSFQYDKAGKLIAKNSKSAYPEEPNVQERFTYDALGKLLKIDKVYIGMGNESIQYIYDIAGKIQAEKWKSDMSDSPEWTILYGYNKDGQVAEKQGLQGTGDDWVSKKMQYDAKGNVTIVEEWKLAEADGAGEMVMISYLKYEYLYW
jgi:hypothetical protein